MAQASRSSKYTSEVLVLGNSLSALLIAEHERQAGKKVVILEPGDRFDGLGRALKLDLDFVPRLPAAKEALDWLNYLLRLDLQLNEIEQGPVHFDEGVLKPFIGFGDRAPISREEVDFYTAPFRYEISPSLTEVHKQLIEQLAPLAQTRKQVTKLLVQEGRLSGVEVNGDEVWTAELVVAPQTPLELIELLSVDAIEGRHRTRLAKASTWGSVSLHLIHKSPISMERGLHILYGSGQESEPVLGRIWPAQENGEQISVWMTFVPRESNEDSDFMAQALKRLKRQLKRPYPNALEDLAEERLIVYTESHGHAALKTKDPLRLPEIEGLLLASPYFSEFRGPLASVDVAAKAANPGKTVAPEPTLTPEVSP